MVFIAEHELTYKAVEDFIEKCDAIDVFIRKWRKMMLKCLKLKNERFLKFTGHVYITLGIHLYL
jgi:hypothetical protein